jgi:hypothetical protein
VAAAWLAPGRLGRVAGVLLMAAGTARITQRRMGMRRDRRRGRPQARPHPAREHSPGGERHDIAAGRLSAQERRAREPAWMAAITPISHRDAAAARRDAACGRGGGRRSDATFRRCAGCTAAVLLVQRERDLAVTSGGQRWRAVITACSREERWAQLALAALGRCPAWRIAYCQMALGGLPRKPVSARR